MIRRPPRSTLDRSSAASDVYKRQAWGSIVFGATLIAGIYGMNFRHMPELDWYWGYAFALGLMAVMSFVLYRVFKRRDWL